MKRVFLIVLIVLIPMLMLAIFSFGADLPKVGDTAPDFTLQSGEGKPISLKDYRGKWVVLYFYPKNFTSGCTQEAHGFQRDQEKFIAANAVVLGVSTDDVASHKSFCSKEGLTFKTLSDADKQVSTAYGSLMNLAVVKLSKRHTFIIDPQGKIAQVYSDVNPNRHSEEVLAALASLEAPKTPDSR